MFICHSDEVMREADANDTSGELGSEFPGSFVGEFVLRIAKLELLTESARAVGIVIHLARTNLASST